VDPRTELLNNVREHLEQEGLPPETIEHLQGLLNAVMTAITSKEPQNQSMLARLVDAFSHNGNLLAIIQQQAAELDAIKRIALNLTSSLELQVVLESVVKEAMRLVYGAEDAHIYLYQDGKINFGASLSADGRKNEQFAEPRPGGLTYKVAQTGEVVAVENMRSHPLFDDAPKEWEGSIVGVPIRMGSRVLGVMNLARAHPGEFSDSEYRLLSLLADQASIAIINARLHQAVSRQAHSDTLTGLPNRRALDERLDSEVKRVGCSGGVFCIIMMDLDGFKQINDTYGHDVGDNVLRQVADALQRTLRGNDFLARYGGDEMTLVLSETNAEQAQVVVQKIMGKMEKLEIQLPQGKTTRLGISGGIAVCPLHGQTSAALLRAADEALYQAKRGGGGRFLFAPETHA
jgi:diguanylate cyclase (GGDEF)-like protein